MLRPVVIDKIIEIFRDQGDEASFLAFVAAFQENPYFKCLKYFMVLKKELYYNERIWPMITLTPKDVRNPVIVEALENTLITNTEIHFLNVPNFIEFCHLTSRETKIILSLEEMSLNSGHVYDILNYVEGSLRVNSLNLYGNYIDSFGCLTMCRIMLTNSNLRELDLNSNIIGDAGACIIASSLLSSNIRKLSLASNGLSPTSCAAIASKAWFLEDLDLSHNDVGLHGAGWIAESLASQYCNLQRLQLQSANLTQKGCILICKALYLNETLQSLTIVEEPGFDDYCTEVLTRAMRRDILQTINLRGNSITAVGVEYLDSGMSGLDNLYEINLNHNFISPYGLQILSKIPNITIICDDQLGNTIIK